MRTATVLASLALVAPLTACRIDWTERQTGTIIGAEALRHYEEAIRLDPKSPEPWNAKGLVLLYGDRKDEARAAFRQALGVDPTYRPARVNLTRSGPQ